MTFITSLDFVWPCRSEKKVATMRSRWQKRMGNMRIQWQVSNFKRFTCWRESKHFYSVVREELAPRNCHLKRFKIPSLWQYLAIQAPATEGEFVGQTNIPDNKTHQKREILFINYKKTWILHKCNWDKFSYVNMDFTDISPRDSICL